MVTPGTVLRRGWTTGTCAAGAAGAAAAALIGGDFPDPVAVALPGGGTVCLTLAEARRDGPDRASVAVIKDAGDDPDVTHGALVRVAVERGVPGTGVAFRAGEGVGTVTRPGLALAPGEPAINPVPRRMIEAALVGAGLSDAIVTVSIPGGEALAARTLNARLGIVGGLSILGTTGIVVPYSCAAWIASIHRGIDVARASGVAHVAACTGSASEAAARREHALPDVALIEMGDFAGGTLRYLRRHPIPRVTVAGGLAKMAKLAQGRLDLHSGRGALDLAALAALAGGVSGIAGSDGVSGIAGAEGVSGTIGSDGVAAIGRANTGAEAFAIADALGVPLGDLVAERAWSVAAALLEGSGTELDILLFDREGRLRGRSHERNRRL